MTPKPIPPLSENDKTNFWKKIDRNGPKMPHMETACHVWMAYKDKKGYGNFRIGGKMFLSHRIAFVQDGGVFDCGNLACHRCDNPGCVNPDHIFSGTFADNNADMISKGRGKQPCGSAHHSKLRPEKVLRGELIGGSKLTEDKVREIREIFEAGGVSQRKIASDYSVSEAQICKIIRRPKWKHVA